MGGPARSFDEVGLLQRLANFRHELLGFLHFSQQAAEAVGLQPQQHQLLLHLAGAPEDADPTIAYVSERLGLRHNSAVELVNRCAESGLVRRRSDAADRRRVVVRITPKGLRLLRSLAQDHARELNDLAPRMIRSLRRIQSAAKPHPIKQAGISVSTSACSAGGTPGPAAAKPTCAAAKRKDA